MHALLSTDNSLSIEVQDVKQMATVSSHQRPTIAIITANYCEKLAVDAMMQDKTTFVRFQTGGMDSLLL